MPKKLIVTILLAVVALAAQAAERPYYLWRDKGGVLNISEVKPRGQSNLVEVPGKSPEISRRPGHTPLGEERQDSAGTAAQDEMTAHGQEINCQIGRLSLDKLKAHKYIFMRGDDGVWRKLSPEELQAQIDKSQKLIDDNCH
ncbi:MAG TPA: hypothetical protein VJ998_03925 [Pseudomonadales bacterium]|nr:hypothetical protein [Pseudomonadales bacterium]